METKKKSILASAIIIGGIAAILTFLLGRILGTSIRAIVLSGGKLSYPLYLVLHAFKGLLAMSIAEIIYVKGFEKVKIPTGALVISSMIAAVIIAFTVNLPRILHHNINSVVYLVIYFVLLSLVAFLFIKMAKTSSKQEEPNRSANRYNSYQAPSSTQADSCPEDIDGLSDSLLKAIKPSLKAPATATICSQEEMRIENNNDEYVIEGYVNSQNSYGAMISTDFTAKARYSNGTWVIGKTAIGIKNAKRYGKNFAINYIVISIFVAVMAILGYFLITMFIG